MKPAGILIRATAALTLVAAGQLAWSQGNGKGPPEVDVNVTNEELNVNLTNGELDVNLTNPTVKIESDVPLDVNITNSATEYYRTPFYFEMKCFMIDASSCTDFLGSASAADFPPEGHTAVIETVWASVNSNDEDARSIALRWGSDLSEDDERQWWTIPFTEVSPGNWDALESLRWYMEYHPSNKIQALFTMTGSVSSASGGASARLRFSGYLVPIESSSLSP